MIMNIKTNTTMRKNFKFMRHIKNSDKKQTLAININTMKD